MLGIYSKTSLIPTNWERTLVQISESPNYGNATENMFREVIKWTSRLFRQYNFILKLAYHKINLLVIKCKNAKF
jgi:hypothetical protein